LDQGFITSSLRRICSCRHGVRNQPARKGFQLIHRGLENALRMACVDVYGVETLEICIDRRGQL